MTLDDRDFRTRRPRHEAQPDATYELLLKLHRANETRSAQLGDLSRQGLKLVTAQEVANDETIQVELVLPGRLLVLSKSATVRWGKYQDDGQWAIGLQFEQELAWEVMGELFLNGVLSYDVVPSYFGQGAK